MSLFSGRARRAAALAAVLALPAAPAGTAAPRAGEPEASLLAHWLPPGALALREAAHPGAEAELFGATLFGRLAETAAFQPFLADLARSRREIALRVAAEADLPADLAAAFMDAPVSLALLDLAPGPEGGLEPVVVLRVSLPRAVDPGLVFAAIGRQINTPANLARAAALLGRPVPVLTYLETWPTAGGPLQVMRVLGEATWHVAVRGPHVLAYRGPPDGALRSVLDRSFADPRAAGGSLAASPGFAAAWRGSGAQPGGSFLYANLQRVQPVLAALAGSQGASVWSALGLDAVQDLGLAGVWTGPGLRHTLYLHAPGHRTGLVAALAPRPVAEAAVAQLPATGGGALAVHADLATLLDELPLLVDAVRRALSPRGAAPPAQSLSFLGAPARDWAAPLGGDLVCLPGPDGLVLRFDSVDVAAFEARVALLEAGAGVRFRERAAPEGLAVRYLHRSAGGLAPLAAYCLFRARPGDRLGTLLLASHPQAIVAQLEPVRPAPRLGRWPDFVRVAEGLGSGYDMFAYVDCRESFVRLYNSLLPVMNLWTDPAHAGWLPGATEAAGADPGGAAGPRRVTLPMLYAWSNSPLRGADPGLLPPGSVLEPALFGLGLGVRTDQAGVTATAYSPLGIWGGAVWLADKLALSHPAAAGMLAARWLAPGP